MRTLCMHGFTLSLSLSLRVRTLGHENPVKWWFKFIRPYYNVDWIFHYFKYLTSATNKRQWRRNGTMTVRSFSSIQRFVGIFFVSDQLLRFAVIVRRNAYRTVFCFTAPLTAIDFGWNRISHCTESRIKMGFPFRFIPNDSLQRCALTMNAPWNFSLIAFIWIQVRVVRSFVRFFCRSFFSSIPSYWQPLQTITHRLVQSPTLNFIKLALSFVVSSHPTQSFLRIYASFSNSKLLHKSLNICTLSLSLIWRSIIHIPFSQRSETVA